MKLSQEMLHNKEVWPASEGLNVVGGGELCYEGMLRKLGPTDCLTTL
jgi:hypothetical protein